MKIFTDDKGKLTKWIIGIAAACILIFLGVENIGAVAKAFSWLVQLVMPLIIGFAIAVILNVPMRFLEERLFPKTEKPFLQKLRRPLSFALAVIFIAAILIGVILLVIPEILEAVGVIINAAVVLVKDINSMSEEELAANPLGALIMSVDWNSLLDSALAWLKNQLGNIANGIFGTVSSFIGGIFDLFVSVVFAIYLLFDKANLKKQAARLARVWLPKEKSEWLIHAGSVLNVSFRNFIAGQSLEAVILGVLCMIGMFIFDFPYAPMVGALVGVTALIPVVGGFIGGGVGAFMMLTVDPMKAIWFLVYFVILQQLEGNLVYPRVMGNRVNLPAMWILAAVSIGGGIGGPIGMLLAVPIASAGYVLFKEATDKREKAINAESQAEKSAEKSAEENPQESAKNAESAPAEASKPLAVASPEAAAEPIAESTPEKSAPSPVESAAESATENSPETILEASKIVEK